MSGQLNLFVEGLQVRRFADASVREKALSWLDLVESVVQRCLPIKYEAQHSLALSGAARAANSYQIAKHHCERLGKSICCTRAM